LYELMMHQAPFFAANKEKVKEKVLNLEYERLD
jgi:hypothetical protein